MRTINQAKKALLLLRRYIARRKHIRGDSWRGRNVASISASQLRVFWWSDEIPLFEIPLVTNAGKAGGYAIIATDPRLPPILQFSTRGPLLSSAIDLSAAPLLVDESDEMQTVRYIYVTSFDLFLEINSNRKGKPTVVSIPYLREIKTKRRSYHRRNPAEIFDELQMKAAWKEFNSRSPKDGSPTIIPNANPVKYNQDCGSYTMGKRVSVKAPTPGTDGPCGARGISGCTPVAFAMFLSSLKRANIAASIWADGQDPLNCWATDWPTDNIAQQDPAWCSTVRETIWRLHSAMKTAVDGSTDTDNQPLATPVLASANFNVNSFKLNYLDGVSDEAMKSILVNTIYLYKMPVIWSAQGTWGGGPVDGHSVVCYGFEPDHYLVGLGWGASFSDPWIAEAQFTSSALFWISNPRRNKTIAR
jgi:hypothetical protein